MAAAEVPTEATRRLQSKKQTLDDAYAAPANFLEIDVVNPMTHGIARTRYTDYEVRMRVKYLHIHKSYTISDVILTFNPCRQIYQSLNSRIRALGEDIVTLNG